MCKWNQIYRCQAVFVQKSVLCNAVSIASHSSSVIILYWNIC